MKNKVHQSVEAPGGAVCIDFFQRPDGSWGFEEYRRDAEDGSGWYRTGHLGDIVYAEFAAAVDSAVQYVPWLADVLPDAPED